MLELIHHPLCPHSRFVRLVLYEYALPVRLIGERIWDRREEFLIMNPAGTVPVLLIEGQPPVPGASIIAELIDEKFGNAFSDRRLFPREPYPRVEVRRLMEWFNSKFFAEVSGPLTAERYKQYMPSDFGGGSPDYQVIRGARENVPDHLAYIASLLRKQDWLAGSGLTYADLAAAAHLSVVNNLDDLTWNEAEAAMAWFARVRSRPSFHSMLTEGWTGFVRN